jgi:hypothetical protein
MSDIDLYPSPDELAGIATAALDLASTLRDDFPPSGTTSDESPSQGVLHDPDATSQTDQHLAKVDKGRERLAGLLRDVALPEPYDEWAAPEAHSKGTDTDTLVTGWPNEVNIWLMICHDMLRITSEAVGRGREEGQVSPIPLSEVRHLETIGRWLHEVAEDRRLDEAPTSERSPLVERLGAALLIVLRLRKLVRASRDRNAQEFATAYLGNPPRWKTLSNYRKALTKVKEGRKALDEARTMQGHSGTVEWCGRQAKFDSDIVGDLADEVLRQIGRYPAVYSPFGPFKQPGWEFEAILQLGVTTCDLTNLWNRVFVEFEEAQEILAKKDDGVVVTGDIEAEEAPLDEKPEPRRDQEPSRTVPMTAQQAADCTGWSAKTIARRLRDHELDVIDLGEGKYRFLQSELDQLKAIKDGQRKRLGNTDS